MARYSRGPGKTGILQKVEGFLNNFWVQLFWKILVWTVLGIAGATKAFLGRFTEGRRARTEWRSWEWGRK